MNKYFVNAWICYTNSKKNQDKNEKLREVYKNEVKGKEITEKTRIFERCYSKKFKEMESAIK